MASTNSANANQQHAGRYPAIHPAVVHFPIVLFPVSAIFLILWFWRDSIFFLNASYWTFMEACLAIIQGFLGSRLVYKYHFGIEPEQGE